MRYMVIETFKSGKKPLVYLHHLAVLESHRRQGIGSRLVEHCLAGLKSLGVKKCNIIVYADNDDRAGFWEQRGWIEQRTWRIRQR